jgi:hypothetical protein
MNRPDLCLAFVNHALWRGQAEPTGTLSEPEDLAGWTAANGAPWLDKPPARREFERAFELRETVHRLFDAEAQDKTPAARDLAALNEARIRCKWRGPCAWSAPGCCSTGRHCRWPMSPSARALPASPLQWPCSPRSTSARRARSVACPPSRGMMAKKKARHAPGLLCDRGVAYFLPVGVDLPSFQI